MIDESVWEDIGPGRKIRRDVDGKITENRLDPSVAAAMGAAKVKNRVIATRETLLQEAGFADPEAAPEHLRVLADIAGSQRSGAVAALRDFLRLTRRQADGEALEFGEVCPLCGSVVGRLTIGDEAMGLIMRDVLGWRDEPIANARGAEPGKNQENMELV